MPFNVSGDQPPIARFVSQKVVFQDGLGERRHVVDSSRGVSLELLCVRPELNAVSSFEFALRERANRLATFRHAYYAPVRGVERVDDGRETLAIVSDVTQGIRLSELLSSLEEKHASLDITAALCLIRQIVPAVAMLHESARDIAHGAIAPERLIVTPNARLVLADFVLGAALEQLRYSHERYWSELRIALPKTGSPPRFDQRADVLQIGLVALSLILGRPLRRDEFPLRIRDLVASAWSASSTSGGPEPLPPGLNVWLGRALQLEALTAFPSAIEARAELEKILGEGGQGASPAGLQAALGRPQDDAPPVRVVVPAPQGRGAGVAREPYARGTSALAALDFETLAEPLGIHIPTSVPDLPPISAAPASRPSAIVLPSLASEPARGPRLSAIDSGLVESVVAARPMQIPDLPAEAPRQLKDTSAIAMPPPPAHSTFQPDQLAALDGKPLAAPLAGSVLGETRAFSFSGADAPGDAPKPKGFRLWKWVGGAAILLPALVAGGAFTANHVGARQAATTTGTLVITTNPAGAQALIDGESKGTTPLTIELPVGTHRVEFIGDASHTIPVTIAAGTQVSQHVDLVADASAATPASAVGPALGAGETTASRLESSPTAKAKTESAVAPPAAQPAASGQATGWATVSGPLALQVFESGRLLGKGQGDRISLAPGVHQLDLVNEELGYRASRSVDIQPGKGTTVQLEVPKGEVALNALPWAEVWIDGEKVGDTPIGNLALALGSHDVVFRHPELGERRQPIVVGLKSPTRVSVDLRK